MAKAAAQEYKTGKAAGAVFQEEWQLPVNRRHQHLLLLNLLLRSMAGAMLLGCE